MTRDRDIHKIDNHLIRWGWILLVIAAIGVLAGLNTTEYRIEGPGGVENVRSSEDLATLRRMHPASAEIAPVGRGPDGLYLWMLAAAALMLGAGYHVRRQENRALAVWGILEHAVEVRAADLCASTGLDRDSLRKVLAVVNAQPDAFYVWDAGTDMIVDGRLRKRAVQVDRCASCGAAVSATITLDLADAPDCTYCGGPISSSADILRLRERTLAEIRDAPAPRKPFSLGIFLLLLIVFWPAAVAYAMWKGGVLDPMLEKLGMTTHGGGQPRA